MCSDQIRGLAFRRSGETNDVIPLNTLNRSIWSDHLLPGRMSDGSNQKAFLSKRMQGLFLLLTFMTLSVTVLSKEKPLATDKAGTARWLASK